MAKSPRKLKTENELLQQLLFVGSVLKDSGTINETHLLLSNNWAVAFNGVLAAGIKTSATDTNPNINGLINLFAAPNYALLVAALAKCGEDYKVEENKKACKNCNGIGGYQVPHFETGIISDYEGASCAECNGTGYNIAGIKITSGKFKAIVPCLDPNLLSIGNIDPPTSSINEEFKKGLEVTAVLASETGQHIYTASILINGQSLISTENGVVIFEYWHGCELPTNIAVPKSFATALSKISKKPVGFGCSQSSITIYFEDESWLRTQLFSEQWPDVGRILNVQSNPFETPKDLWEGLSAIAPHSVDGLVYFSNNSLHSHSSDSVGASFEVKGLPKGPVFNIKQLMFLKDHAKQIDFFAHGPNGQMTYFVGANCRGVVAGRVQK